MAVLAVAVAVEAVLLAVAVAAVLIAVAVEAVLLAVAVLELAVLAVAAPHPDSFCKSVCAS